MLLRLRKKLTANLKNAGNTSTVLVPMGRIRTADLSLTKGVLYH